MLCQLILAKQSRVEVVGLVRLLLHECYYYYDYYTAKFG